MNEPLRIRTRTRDGRTEVSILLPHPMETGLRANELGTLVPAHFITAVRVEVDHRAVLDARLSMAVSRDPLLSFRCRGLRPGAEIAVTWTDNRGDRGAGRSVVA